MSYGTLHYTIYSLYVMNYQFIVLTGLPEANPTQYNQVFPFPIKMF